MDAVRLGRCTPLKNRCFCSWEELVEARALSEEEAMNRMAIIEGREAEAEGEEARGKFSR